MYPDLLAQLPQAERDRIDRFCQRYGALVSVAALEAAIAELLTRYTPTNETLCLKPKSPIA